MVSYKQSQYNIMLPLTQDDNVFIYNTKSGAIVKLEHSIYTAICTNNFEQREVIQCIDGLLAEGIIVDARKNEFNEILFNQRREQYNCANKKLTIVVSPTLSCNYRCVYCFEGNTTSDIKIMTQDTMSDIISYLEQYILIHQNVKLIRVQWFGGEPLLAYKEVIIPLSQKFIEFCHNKRIAYESSIITNGYLLNNDIASALVTQYYVSSFQITFDGTEENYRKYKKPPKNAYNRVLENIFCLAKFVSENNFKAKISIRINVHKDNSNDALALSDRILSDERYNKHISLYLGHVINSNACNCFDLDDFEQIEKHFSMHIKKPLRKFEPKKVWCSQYTINNFCIGPQGEMYACEHDFGKTDRIIGNVKFGMFYNEYYLEYLNQPVHLKCASCKLFPLCLGGCPNQRFNNETQHSCEVTFSRIVDQACDYIRNKNEEVNHGGY